MNLVHFTSAIISAYVHYLPYPLYLSLVPHPGVGQGTRGGTATLVQVLAAHLQSHHVH